MNILILNWRDPKNPRSGGAEKITAKYASYWVSKGHSVIWLTNSFDRAKSNEEYQGVLINRIGPSLSLSVFTNLFLYPLFLFNAILHAKMILMNKEIDLVIDEIHGFPFFTPLYSTKKNILLVCEVAGEIWDKMYPFPINLLGKKIERLIYNLYSKTEIWAISNNTKKDILLLNPKYKVKILPLGIDLDPNIIDKYKSISKNNVPSAVFIARLVKMKGIEQALTAASEIVQKLPDFKLFIIGRGNKEYEEYLERRVKEDRLENVVNFMGYVTDDQKYEILAKSHFLIHPSYKEGFGLTVLEAGLVKTPSIVKQGSSLDELVTDKKDGYIIHNSNEIAEKFIESYKSKSYTTLCENAWIKAQQFNWKTMLLSSKDTTGL